MKFAALLGTALTLISFDVTAFTAQVVNGTLGTPSATTTIDGRQIPPPPGQFGGKINLDALQSTPYWQPQVAPPKGAPNVLLILTDDVGFAAPSTFGGVIPTPTLDRIASMGLRYTDSLGTYNDAVCACDQISIDLKDRSNRARWIADGVVIGWQRRNAEALREPIVRAWHRLKNADLPG